MEQNISADTYALQIDTTSINYLTEAAKWAKFLAIVGFIFCALMVVFGLLARTIFYSFLDAYSNEMSNAANVTYYGMGSTILSVIYIVIAIIFFIPCLFLFNYASKAQSAIRKNDQLYLNSSFKNLKSFFKFWGIVLVISLCLNLITVIFAIVGGYTFSR